MFDKFYRVQKSDHVRLGTGLGLVISRGFIEAMLGAISAANRADRSVAVLTVCCWFPCKRKRWIPPHERAGAQGPGHRR